MMALEFFIWGAWLPLIFGYLPSLGFSPGEIMMVAAHKFDLKAANAAGFKTAYIPRPVELGPETKIDRSPETYIDVVADDMIDLSRKIGLA